LHGYEQPKDVIYHSDKGGNFHKIYKTPEAQKFYTQMDNLEKHYNEGTINTETFNKNMKKLKDDYHGKPSPVGNDLDATALNKSPPEGGMSLAGQFDKLLNDLDDGVISKAKYNLELAKLQSKVPTPHDSPTPNPHSPKGTWTAAPPPKSILNNPELYGGSPDPNIAAKKLQDDIAASTKNYNIDFKAALEHFQKFKKKKD
jgi:soluble cytochrome b562